MSVINEKAVERLNHLIAIANDGKYGYENAAEDIKDITLKQMFRQYSVERARYVEELKKQLISQQLSGIQFALNSIRALTATATA